MKAKSARRVHAAGRTEDAGGAVFLLDEATARKLKSVLRLGPGDPITVVDDEGIGHACRILSLERGRAIARPEDGPGQALPEPVPVTLGLAVIKGDRMDWAVEKLSEAGVDRVLPILCDRSTSREIGEAKRERWTRIADAASLQCGRSRPATVLAPATSLEAALDGFKTAWHGDPEGRTARELMLAPALPEPDLLLVGPEGGWSEQERAVLESRSTAVSLGAFVLRTETAALAISLLAIQIISKSVNRL